MPVLGVVEAVAPVALVLLEVFHVERAQEFIDPCARLV
jgi:hypothetical protein